MKINQLVDLVGGQAGVGSAQHVDTFAHQAGGQHRRQLARVVAGESHISGQIVKIFVHVNGDWDFWIRQTGLCTLRHLQGIH